MEYTKIPSCKLCLSDINDENYELIEDVTKEILSVLLLKLNFEEDSKYVMCNLCLSKLHAALKFKSTCLYTNNAIISYVDNATMLPKDIKDIYMKQRGNVQTPDDIKICRLCMQQIKNVLEFKSINEDQVYMMQEIVPEVNIFVINEPIMCNICQDSLATHFNFLKKCSDVEKNNECISRVQDTPSPDVSVKLEQVVMDFEDVKHSIETECLDIKDEDIKTESEFQKQEAESEACLKYNYESNGKPSASKHKMEHKEDENVHENKCDNYKYETKNTAIKTHMLKHKAKYINSHKMQKDPSKVQLYKCQQCDFKSKFKFRLKTHGLTHKDPSEVTMYKCGNCSYETKRKCCLKEHTSIHQDPTEAQMYKCANCDYAAKLKGNLKNHMLIHKDPSQVQMYKCEHCNHVTKHKGCLKKHMLVHKDPSQLHMYKCEHCNYVTKHKESLKLHTLVHKDPLEMYQCKYCNYATRHKGNLEIHMLKHKRVTHVKIHKCETCNYETVHRNYFEKHVLTHKRPSEVQMYNCANCMYASKYKGNLKMHMIIHKNSSEVQLYKCGNCNYETKRKRDLKRHGLTHKS